MTNTEKFNYTASQIKRSLAMRLRQTYGYLDVGLMSVAMFNQVQRSAKSEALYLLTQSAIIHGVSLLSLEMLYQEKAIEHIMSNEGGN